MNLKKFKIISFRVLKGIETYYEFTVYAESAEDAARAVFEAENRQIKIVGVIEM